MTDEQFRRMKVYSKWAAVSVVVCFLAAACIEYSLREPTKLKRPETKLDVLKKANEEKTRQLALAAEQRRSQRIAALEKKVHAGIGNFEETLNGAPSATVELIATLEADIDSLQTLRGKPAWEKSSLQDLLVRHHERVEYQSEKHRVAQSLRSPSDAMAAIAYGIRRGSMKDARRALSRARKRFPDAFKVNPIPTLLKTTSASKFAFLKETFHHSRNEVCYRLRSPEGWRNRFQKAELRYSDKPIYVANPRLSLPACFPIESYGYPKDCVRIIDLHFRGRAPVMQHFSCGKD